MILLGHFLGFAYKVNELGIFCGDGIILWSDFGSNMMSIFVKNSSWVNMWEIMGNICEMAQGNL